MSVNGRVRLAISSLLLASAPLLIVNGADARPVSGKASPEVEKRAKDAVSQRIHRFYAALVAADSQALEECWDRDLAISVAGDGHERTLGWTAYYSQIVPVFELLKSGKLRVAASTSHHLVTIEGNFAWANFMRRIATFGPDGKETVVEGISTAVLRRRDNKWRIVHLITSDMPTGNVFVEIKS